VGSSLCCKFIADIAECVRIRYLCVIEISCRGVNIYCSYNKKNKISSRNDVPHDAYRIYPFKYFSDEKNAESKSRKCALMKQQCEMLNSANPCGV